MNWRNNPMKLEKLIDGEWWTEGDYPTPNGLAAAAFNLGRNAAAEQVRVTANASNAPRMTLYCQIGQNWYLHGSYTDMTAMIRAVRQLCQNPDVVDFRVQPY
jgi:hypothetical protein